MKVQLRFFSVLRDLVGTGKKTIEIDSPLPAAEIFRRQIGNRSLAERLLPSVRFAIDCEYVPPETLVRDGNELACVPPVSGG